LVGLALPHRGYALFKVVAQPQTLERRIGKRRNAAWQRGPLRRNVRQAKRPTARAPRFRSRWPLEQAGPWTGCVSTTQAHPVPRGAPFRFFNDRVFFRVRRKNALVARRQAFTPVDKALQID